MVAERWRAVEGYRGLYEVSDRGRVRRIGTTRGRKGAVRKATPGSHGYLTVKLSKDGVTSTHCVHVMVARAFVPNPRKLPEVNHEDGNKLRCLASNLEWTTRSGNLKHAYAIGLRVVTALMRRKSSERMVAMNKARYGTR